MSTIVRHVEVAVPLDVAYDQWSEVEEFPRFMPAVERVRRLDDRSTRWVVRIAGSEREFHAEVVVRRPDEGLSWHTLAGPAHSGRVLFTPITDERTRVEVTVSWEAQGVAETVGDVLGVVDRGIAAQLAAFKEFIEQRGEATGGRRGVLDDASGPGTGTAPEVALAPSDVEGRTGTAADRASRLRRVRRARAAGPPAPPARG